MIGEIWDYLMRRKPVLWLLLVLLALGGVIGAKLMMEHRLTVSQAQEIGVGPAPVYNNSLTFRIPGKSGRTAYELVLANDFRSAKVTVTAEAVASEAYVRVLNPSGQLSTGEQTALVSGELQFSGAPKTYSLQLGRGYIIEVYGTNVQVLSNLTNSPATAFMPSGATERYVLLPDGIRKSTWNDTEGKTALYNLLKNYIVGQIETYKSRLSDEVLNNKNLDVAAKTQIVLAYRNLSGADQAPYRDFINNLVRGGVPVITYSGKREYTVGESVDFAKLVSVRDGEDGEYAASQIITQPDVDFNQAGKYTLSYQASDSDRNTVTMRIPITIVEAKADNAIPAPEVPTNNIVSEVPSVISNQAPTIGGGMNIETEPIEPSAEDNTIWDNHNTDINTDIAYAPSAVQASEPEKRDTESHGISASQIVLLILGIVLLFGLVRFIFDHYVR